MTNIETRQPDLTNAKTYAYYIAAEDPAADRGERWFVVGDHKDEDENVVWYRSSSNAGLRMALIKASTLRGRDTWVRIES